MLKQNYQKNPKESKLHQAVLKHKVRNLRAKVQSLLPIHFCQKIFKRNNRLNNKLLRKRLLHIKEHPEHTHHTRSVNSLTCTQTPWKYTSGYNLKKSGLDWHQPMPETSHQSAKTSFHGSVCECQQENELFFDDEFLSIGKEGQPGKGKSKKQAMMNGYHFQRLTDDEIEQIGEDKLYYLGEERHIQAYEKFTKEKFMRKTTTPISNEVYKSVSKSTIAFGTSKHLQGNMKLQTNTSLESQNTLNKDGSRKVQDMWLRKKSKNSSNRRENDSIMHSKDTIHNISEQRVFRNTTNQKQAWNVNENLARINEEEQIKRILLSMELQNKQQKGYENFKKIMNTRIQIIEQENLKENFKILTAQEKKRKIHNEVGQIVDLTEKLRKKCIKRKTMFGKEKISNKSQTLNIQN